MAVVVRLRPAGPGRAEIIDRDSLQQNAPRPYGFAPKPRPIPDSVGLAAGELDGRPPDQVRTRLAELAVSAVKPHYPNGGAVEVEWLDETS